jgi:hypothetical protein
MEFMSIFENEIFIEALLIEERDRRIQFEGPPHENLQLVTMPTGEQYKIRENGRPWDVNRPCTSCSDEECLAYITELSDAPPVTYIYNDIASICNHPNNAGLLRMLCAWRKHVKNTFIVEKPCGSEKWKRYSICTSELTFLGRNTEMGGILGILSKTNTHVCSLPSLVSLTEKETGVHDGVKCLSAGFALLIAMYMDWDLYTEENKVIVGKLLKKVRKDGKVGIDTYIGSPWYTMFQCVLQRRRIPDKLREFILSRAHLP